MVLLVRSLFCYCIIRDKRFYPRILIHLIIKYKVKKALKNENAPQTIQNLYKQIAEIIYLSAMGGYAKNKDVKKLINKYFI